MRTLPGSRILHLGRPVVPGRRDLLPVQPPTPLHLSPLRGALDGRPEQPRPAQVRLVNGRVGVMTRVTNWPTVEFDR